MTTPDRIAALETRIALLEIYERMYQDHGHDTLGNLMHRLSVAEPKVAALSAQNAALRKALKYARRFLDESVLDIAFIDEALALPAPEPASDG